MAGHPLEAALVRALRLLVAGGLGALVLLAVRAPTEATAQPLLLTHLSGLVALGLAGAVWIAPLIDRPGWFPQLERVGRRWASAASLVAVVTGLVGLATLASSAALRFHPSLQLLQLLSALDIVWAGTALYLGVRWLAGTNWALVAGVGLGVFCVWSIWRYLDEVGLGPEGSWLVDGSALWRLVIPADVAAAVAALAMLGWGARREPR